MFLGKIVTTVGDSSPDPYVDADIGSEYVATDSVISASSDDINEVVYVITIIVINAYIRQTEMFKSCYPHTAPK